MEVSICALVSPFMLTAAAANENEILQISQCSVSGISALLRWWS